MFEITRFNGSCLFVLLLLFSCGEMEDAFEEDENLTPTENLHNFFQEALEYEEIPGLAVAISKGDELLFEGYYGQANIEDDLSVDENTVFLLASASKTVTGTALLQLLNAENISLDEPINDYLPFDVYVPGYNTEITFRMLLTHTSGIGDNDDLMDQNYFFGEDSPIGFDEYFRNYLTESGSNYDDYENFFDFGPGEDHEYSNTGSALNGYLIEVISEMPFEDYCAEYIFDPLCMDNTGWRLADFNPGELAMTYEYNEDATGHYTFTDFPNGGLRSTARDMVKFASAFAMEGMAYIDTEILPASVVAEATSRQIPDLNSTVGLHWFVMNESPLLWGHDGAERGVSTVVAFHKETDISLAILANGDEVEIENLLIQAYQAAQKIEEAAEPLSCN